MAIDNPKDLGACLLKCVEDAASLSSKEVIATLVGVLVAEASDRYGSDKAGQLLREAADILDRPAPSAH